jgi:hypothetical protein
LREEEEENCSHSRTLSPGTLYLREEGEENCSHSRILYPGTLYLREEEEENCSHSRILYPDTLYLREEEEENCSHSRTLSPGTLYLWEEEEENCSQPPTLESSALVPTLYLREEEEENCSHSRTPLPWSRSPRLSPPEHLTSSEHVTLALLCLTACKVTVVGKDVFTVYSYWAGKPSVFLICISVNADQDPGFAIKLKVEFLISSLYLF